MGKQKHEEHENHERWIIPYADMVTLLFAFFVVMYSISQQDLAKLKNVSESVSEAFLGQKKGGKKAQHIHFSGMDTAPDRSPRFVVKRTVTNQEVVDEIRREMDKQGFDFVYQQKLSPLQITIDSRGVVISISAGYLFDAGSTEVKPELYPVIGVVADVLKRNTRLIDVEGHTDAEPTVGSLYYDNWDLAALRATSMVRVLTQEFGIDPKRTRAASYGRNRPVADERLTGGKDQNRRVEIIMLNAHQESDLYEDEGIPR